MKLVLQYFYKKRQVIRWSILCGLIYLLIFSLSGIDLKAAVYPALLGDLMEKVSQKQQICVKKIIRSF